MKRQRGFELRFVVGDFGEVVEEGNCSSATGQQRLMQRCTLFIFAAELLRQRYEYEQLARKDLLMQTSWVIPYHGLAVRPLFAA